MVEYDVINKYIIIIMKLTCKDINPDTTCDFEVTGETATEVATKMVEHAKTHHTDEVKSMSDGEMIKEFESKVHN